MELRVLTHSGEDVIVKVGTYNANVLNTDLNNMELNTVAIGDMVFSRIDVKMVQPINSKVTQI